MKAGAVVCPRCVAAEDADYDRVYAALADVDGPTAHELADLAGVALDCVLRMVDLGLLHNVRPGETVPCGRCGAPAISFRKRLCRGCLNKLNQSVAQAISNCRSHGSNGTNAAGKPGHGRMVKPSVIQEAEKEPEAARPL